MVRYQYATINKRPALPVNGRKFCEAMVRVKRIYRKEDIDRASCPIGDEPKLIAGFGHKDGASLQYSIWLYKEVVH